jgi:23S rRNA pseudouridine2605 synthase
MRLNKFLSECGIGSRRNVEELIKQGRVAIDGKTVVKLAVEVQPEENKVSLDGEEIKLKERVYFLLNKPKGYITSVSDEKNRHTVIELIKTKVKIYPIGRLDYNTTGVLLLTNDGDFTNFMTHPNNGIPRIYLATLDKPLEKTDEEKLIRGLVLEGKKGKFISVKFPRSNNKKIVQVTSVEGRNHFVKKMFHGINYRVTDLSRIRYADFVVHDMPVGAYRKLTIAEIASVMRKYAEK